MSNETMKIDYETGEVVESGFLPAPVQQVNELAVMDVREQVNKIQQLMKSVMQENEHYGKIPGCGNKPALFKAGAEKIGFVFRLAPFFEKERIDLPDGHREYEVTCTLKHIESGLIYGQGVGSCSSMESKYRYRNESALTEIPVPKAYWDNNRDINVLRKAANAKPGDKVAAKKDEDSGKWFIAMGSGKVENPDIADQFNTVLKMAKKRAFVDATLTATAASDIFTQDIEDMPRESVSAPPAAPQAPTPPPAKPKKANKDDWVRKYLKQIGDYKEQVVKLSGSTDLYYELLGSYGVEHANALKTKVKFEGFGFRLAMMVEILTAVETAKAGLSKQKFDQVLRNMHKIHEYDWIWTDAPEGNRATLEKFNGFVSEQLNQN